MYVHQDRYYITLFFFTDLTEDLSDQGQYNFRIVIIKFESELFHSRIYNQFVISGEYVDYNTQNVELSK